MRIKVMMALGILALFASLSGCIGFHYFESVDNQPLENPVRVRAVRSTDLLELEDGRRVRLAQEIPDLEVRIESSKNEVEVVPRGVSPDGAILADVFVKEPIGYCGTPWAKWITIPLFADRHDGWMRWKLEPR